MNALSVINNLTLLLPYMFFTKPMLEMGSRLFVRDTDEEKQTTLLQ